MNVCVSVIVVECVKRGGEPGRKFVWLSGYCVFVVVAVRVSRKCVCVSVCEAERRECVSVCVSSQ